MKWATKVINKGRFPVFSTEVQAILYLFSFNKKKHPRVGESLHRKGRAKERLHTGVNLRPKFKSQTVE